MLSDEFQEEGPARQNTLSPPPDAVDTTKLAPPPVLSPTVSDDTVHQYNLMSDGRVYALITVMSHAPDVQYPPLLYFGEELKGSVTMSLDDLNDMEGMYIIVSQSLE